jgi:hypothetical protein
LPAQPAQAAKSVRRFFFDSDMSVINKSAAVDPAGAGDSVSAPADVVS